MRVFDSKRGSMNLELALLIALLVLGAVASLTFMGNGINNIFGIGGSKVNGAPIIVAGGTQAAPVLTWEPVNGATSYEVQESTDGGVTWVPAGTPTNPTVTEAAVRYLYPLLFDNFDWNMPNPSGTADVGNSPPQTNDANKNALNHGSVHYFNNDQTIMPNTAASTYITAAGQIVRSNLGVDGIRTWNTDFSFKDGVVSVVRDDAGAGTAYLIARASDVNNYYRLTMTSGGTIVFKKCVAGTITTISTQNAAYTATPGQTLGFKVDGTTLQAQVNGVDVGTPVTDNSLTVGYWGAGPGNNTAILDDLRIYTYSVTYWYRVRAVGPDGNSTWSQPVQVN